MRDNDPKFVYLVPELYLALSLSFKQGLTPHEQSLMTNGIQTCLSFINSLHMKLDQDQPAVTVALLKLKLKLIKAQKPKGVTKEKYLKEFSDTSERLLNYDSSSSLYVTQIAHSVFTNVNEFAEARKQLELV